MEGYVSALDEEPDAEESPSSSETTLEMAQDGTVREKNTFGETEDEAQAHSPTKAKTKGKPKTKGKAKPKAVSKAKAKPKTKDKSEDAMRKMWKHCQGASKSAKVKK